MNTYEFSENNSGGSWWLNRAQYDALFEAGWVAPEETEDDKGYNFLDTKDVPWSWRHNLTLQAESLQDAVENWETATGENFFAGGCPCCGAPFSISGSGPNYEYASGGYEEMSRPF